MFIYRWISFLSLISCFGCAALFVSPVQKELFSSLVPIDRVDIIKSAISQDGYKMIREDHYYAGAYATNFVKELPLDDSNVLIEILLSYKKDEAVKDHYRNLGISVSCEQNCNASQVKAEINRIEEILHGKLIEGVGKNNVKRGKKEIYNAKTF